MDYRLKMYQNQPKNARIFFNTPLKPSHTNGFKSCLFCDIGRSK